MQVNLNDLKQAGKLISFLAKNGINYEWSLPSVNSEEVVLIAGHRRGSANPPNTIEIV